MRMPASWDTSPAPASTAAARRSLPRRSTRRRPSHCFARGHRSRRPECDRAAVRGPRPAPLARDPSAGSHVPVRCVSESGPRDLSQNLAHAPSPLTYLTNE